MVVELAAFSPGVLDHFIFLERPEGKELSDSSEFVHPAEYHRGQPKDRLMPHAQDYNTVGHLYRGIRHGFEVLAHHLGEEALFCGDPASQLTRSEASLPGLMAVTDLKSADEAIETIIEQGEGAPEHSDDSHYSRFLRVRQEYDTFLREDPTFAPAFPVAHNPVMRRPLDAAPARLYSRSAGGARPRPRQRSLWPRAPLAGAGVRARRRRRSGQADVRRCGDRPDVHPHRDRPAPRLAAGRAATTPASTPA